MTERFYCTALLHLAHDRRYPNPNPNPNSRPSQVAKGLHLAHDRRRELLHVLHRLARLGAQ